MFVHFTSRAAAEAIVVSGHLNLSNVIVNAVFAAGLGGSSVPGVQHDITGAREVAVLFTAEPPDTIFPEEVIWHRTTSLPITDAQIIDATIADGLLNGSAEIPDDGVHHQRDCECPGCACYYETVALHSASR